MVFAEKMKNKKMGKIFTKLKGVKMEDKETNKKTTSSKSGTSTTKKTGTGSGTKSTTTRKSTSTKTGATQSGTSSTKRTSSTGNSGTTAKKTTSTRKTSSNSATKSVTTEAKKEVKKDANKKADEVLTKNVPDFKIGDKSVNMKGLLKGVSLVAKIVAIVMFIVGAVLGSVVGIVLCKDDTFELIECNTSYEVGLDTPINVEGVKLISFGRDISDSVNIELSEGLKRNEDGTITVLDTSVEGIYHIIYTTSDFKYQKIQKIRYIYIVSFNETGESAVYEE